MLEIFTPNLALLATPYGLQKAHDDCPVPLIVPVAMSPVLLSSSCCQPQQSADIGSVSFDETCDTKMNFFEVEICLTLEKEETMHRRRRRARDWSNLGDGGETSPETLVWLISPLFCDWTSFKEISFSDFRSKAALL